MNAAGYRYGASDEAFYIPAVLRHLDPALFPRDAVLIDSQARLTLVDEAIALVVRASGMSLQTAFLALYLLTLGLLATGALRIGALFYRSPWTVLALTAALTLRHAIAKTGTNTLEAYFHPRQLAFALGLLGVAAFLSRRDWAWIALVAAAAIVHPTTAAWFGLWLVVAAWLGRPSWRKPLAVLAGVALLAAAWALWRGPLAGRLVRMDADWLAVIADRDYLFPLAWPLDAWLTNLVTVPVIFFGWRARHRAGLTIGGKRRSYPGRSPCS